MAKKYIIKVGADGRVTRERFCHKYALGQLHKTVGGYLDQVPTPQTEAVDIFVDAEGLRKILPENGVLMRFVYHRYKSWLTLVGDAVITAHDRKGNTVGLSESMCEELMASLIRCGGEGLSAEKEGVAA